MQLKGEEGTAVEEEKKQTQKLFNNSFFVEEHLSPIPHEEEEERATFDQERRSNKEQRGFFEADEEVALINQSAEKKREETKNEEAERFTLHSIEKAVDGVTEPLVFEGFLNALEEKSLEEITSAAFLRGEEQEAPPADSAQSQAKIEDRGPSPILEPPPFELDEAVLEIPLDEEQKEASDLIDLSEALA